MVILPVGAGNPDMVRVFRIWRRRCASYVTVRECAMKAALHAAVERIGAV
jgi:hypothetical protein